MLISLLGQPHQSSSAGGGPALPGTDGVTLWAPWEMPEDELSLSHALVRWCSGLILGQVWGCCCGLGTCCGCAEPGRDTKPASQELRPSLFPGVPWPLDGPAAPDSSAGHHRDARGAGLDGAEVSAASGAHSPHHRWPQVFQVSSKEEEQKEQGPWWAKCVVVLLGAQAGIVC